MTMAKAGTDAMATSAQGRLAGKIALNNVMPMPIALRADATLQTKRP